MLPSHFKWFNHASVNPAELGTRDDHFKPTNAKTSSIVISPHPYNNIIGELLLSNSLHSQN
uniref:Uncharacterized protein n=1 Tax=Arion vulgaris TaxID=1028688 RepID=A0A0B6ZUB7_9EUPU